MLNILYVDDEPDLREIVEAALALDDGLHIDSCANGMQALQRVSTAAPDLILLDVMMPGMDGTAVLARLHQTTAIPVIFVTAKAQPVEIERLVALGAIGVIRKPFDPRTLAADIRALCRQAGLQMKFDEPSALDTVQARLREKFAASAPATVVSLRQAMLAMETGDYKPLIALAHTLTGSAGTFGYLAISEKAAPLEEAALSEKSDLCRYLAGLLEKSLEIVCNVT